MDPAFDHEAERFGADKEAAAKAFAEEFQRCMETQDYSSLCKPGQTPTIFWFRPLKFSEVDRVVSMQLGNRATTVIFRLCLKQIADASLAGEIKRTTDHEFKELGSMVSASWLDDLVAKVGDFDFVHSLGDLVFARSKAPSPKP